MVLYGIHYMRRQPAVLYTKQRDIFLFDVLPRLTLFLRSHDVLCGLFSVHICITRPMRLYKFVSLVYANNVIFVVQFYSSTNVLLA